MFGWNMCKKTDTKIQYAQQNKVDGQRGEDTQTNERQIDSKDLYETPSL